MFRLIDDAAFRVVCRSLWFAEEHGVSRQRVMHALDLFLAGCLATDGAVNMTRGHFPVGGFCLCLAAVWIMIVRVTSFIPPHIVLPLRSARGVASRLTFVVLGSLNAFEVFGRGQLKCILSGLFDVGILLREHLLCVPPKPPRKRREQASELTLALAHAFTGARLPT
jgi:hypothetical protein